MRWAGHCELHFSCVKRWDCNGAGRHEVYGRLRDRCGRAWRMGGRRLGARGCHCSASRICDGYGVPEWRGCWNHSSPGCTIGYSKRILQRVFGAVAVLGRLPSQWAHRAIPNLPDSPVSVSGLCASIWDLHPPAATEPKPASAQPTTATSAQSTPAATPAT